MHVIGTERHTARRIDNQLRGRGGRQGDPGSSRFYVSLQDELMKIFAGEWTIKVLGWLGMEEGMAIEDKRITKGIVRAQKKVEERNFLGRKNLLEYDEVMDHQRTTFYGMRQRVLLGKNVEGLVWDMIGESIADAVDKYITRISWPPRLPNGRAINFDTTFEPDDLKGMRTIQELRTLHQNQAYAETQTNITATLGEFMGEDESTTPVLGHQGPAKLGHEPVSSEPVTESDSPDDRYRCRGQSFAPPPTSKSNIATARA